MIEKTFEYSFGPRMRDHGVEFRVWAPGAEKLELLIDPQENERRYSMTPVKDDYFECFVEGAGPGTRYFLFRDAHGPMPDPASRFQPDGVWGPSEVVDLHYAWQTTRWRGLLPEELIIYELHLGTFCSERRYTGLQNHLNDLQDLGITAVEIMPLATFPGRWNWGYDGVFHFAPFAGYGHPSELMRLVDGLHAKGIAAILDIVTNHFGPEGNAMWSMAPSFFRPDRPTAWSAGLNWDCEQVLRYFDEVARFWIDVYHFDGIRFDAFHAVPDWIRRKHLKRMVDALEHPSADDRLLFILLESSDNQASLLECSTERIHVAQFNFDFQRASHALVTGERHREYGDFKDPHRELGQCLKQGFAFAGRYSHYRGRICGESRGPATWDGLVNFIQNHDSIGNRYRGQRLDHLTDPELLRALTALMMFHPSIPFIFMGQEWNARSPFHFFTDFPEALGQVVQKGRKQLFQELDAKKDNLPSAPGCQEREAFERSQLIWNELKSTPCQETLAFMKKIIGVRKQVLPQMSLKVSDLKVIRQGAQYLVEIGPRNVGDDTYYLAANLESGGMDCPKGMQVIFSTQPIKASTIPGQTTALGRCPRNTPE